jgi:hypothetical protein
MIRGHSTATIGLCECLCPNSLCLCMQFQCKNRDLTFTSQKPPLPELALLTALTMLRMLSLSRNGSDWAGAKVWLMHLVLQLMTLLRSNAKPRRQRVWQR